jgi:hypothetical protein
MKSDFNAGRHVSAVYEKLAKCYIAGQDDGGSKKELTPMFISTDPQRRSMELLPSFWTCLIWSIRMMEQATVKLPAAKRMIRLTLWRVSICSRMNSGIGMRKVMMSHTIVMDAVA